MASFVGIAVMAVACSLVVAIASWPKLRAAAGAAATAEALPQINLVFELIGATTGSFVCFLGNPVFVGRTGVQYQVEVTYCILLLQNHAKCSEIWTIQSTNSQSHSMPFLGNELWSLGGQPTKQWILMFTLRSRPPFPPTCVTLLQGRGVRITVVCTLHHFALKFWTYIYI